MALPALLINIVALLVACSGAWVLFITRLHAQRAIADLALRSERALQHDFICPFIRRQPADCAMERALSSAANCAEFVIHPCAKHQSSACLMGSG